MEERENLKEGRLITLKSKESMIDLLYLSCIKGLNCLCILDSLTKEYLVQKLLLEYAGVNLDNNLTLEDYKYLVRAMHDMCKWGLYIDKFQTIAKTNNKIKKLKPDYVFIESEQDIISDKHWKTMAEKRQVIIVLTSYNDEIFNEDGKHKLEKPSKKPEAKRLNFIFVFRIQFYIFLHKIVCLRNKFKCIHIFNPFFSCKIQACISLI